jgi:hypothetical protein
VQQKRAELEASLGVKNNWRGKRSSPDVSGIFVYPLYMDGFGSLIFFYP